MSEALQMADKFRRYRILGVRTYIHPFPFDCSIWIRHIASPTCAKGGVDENLKIMLGK
jgi:hypothetical protein